MLGPGPVLDQLGPGQTGLYWFGPQFQNMKTGSVPGYGPRGSKTGTGPDRTFKH
jgi:hypothetical protein